MAYPASKQTLEDTLKTVSNLATALKSEVGRISTQSETQPVNRQEFISLIRRLSGAIAAWNTAAALPGIAAYAQEQFGDATLDVAVEFVAMRDAAAAIKNNIESTFPKDATSGAWLVSDYDADGNPIPLTFSSASLATFRSLAATFSSTIN